MSDIITKKEIFAIAADPIYIGTGGYTIGRVDNTIVRDPVTKVPKIPGSSLAGTWRYYVSLELISKIKNYQPEFEKIKNVSSGNEISDKEEKKSLSDKIEEYNWKNVSQEEKKEFEELKNWLKFEGNQIAKITCAGQDNVPTAGIESPDVKTEARKTGHCGHCIVCKAFGYSKKDKSWQGMLFFSDLNILFFPVYTRFGVKWIASKRILKEAGLLDSNNNTESQSNETIFVQEKIEDNKENGHINLGWLNLPYIVKSLSIKLSAFKTDGFQLSQKDIIIVSDSLISQIINSNLEVRTSVSIDPITGAAKERALFTSEAIPRGTIFYGEIRLFDKSGFSSENLPSESDIFCALEDTKKYYETLGIGGMTTRGFGRMKIFFDLKDGECEK
ncbi:MAG TPA: hypothetical protein ENI51_08110 [Candidatus Atribacteria bacterium]|nr:hypothetical protein [Candidatus Atribacteria bacterium]